MDRHRQSADAGRRAVCQIAVMQGGILRLLAVFPALAPGSVAGVAQAQQGGAEWDNAARNPVPLPSVTPNNQNALLDQLNKILQASQLSPTDRTFYLSVRAFM